VTEHTAVLDCCIPFLHHLVDETTWRHLDLLRRQNPYPVVVLTNGSPDRVAGTLNVAIISTRSHKT